MPTPFLLVMPRGIYREIVCQARAELPNECCGILAGRLGEGPQGAVGRVQRRYPLVNAAASPKEFESDARSMVAAEKSRRVEGLEFLAIYHSHPSSPPVPSAKDLAQSYSPDLANLIVSLQSEVVVARAWWLRADGYDEAAIDWID